MTHDRATVTCETACDAAITRCHRAANRGQVNGKSLKGGGVLCPAGMRMLFADGRAS